MYGSFEIRAVRVALGGMSHVKIYSMHTLEAFLQFISIAESMCCSQLANTDRQTDSGVGGDNFSVLLTEARG